MGCGEPDLEEVEIGVGSDIRGRMDDELGPELLELAACLAELVVPAPSLADEVRLPEFGWSSDWFAVWDFGAMVGRQKSLSGCPKGESAPLPVRA